jgi:hypothetical protein
VHLAAVMRLVVEEMAKSRLQALLERPSRRILVLDHTVEIGTRLYEIDDPLIMRDAFGAQGVKIVVGLRL